MPDPSVVRSPLIDPINELVSICIPTYRRVDLLEKAMDSCFGQEWPQIEVVIGDDSPDDATENFIADMPEEKKNRVRYKHHRPSLGQNGNVNDLFARANGSRLLLLHDDDILLPGAVGKLARLWDQCPTLDAAFGKQMLLRHDGTPAPDDETDTLNSGYFRTSANAGRQQMPVIAGLRRMFPNDGFMVTTELARSIGYRPMEEVGHACDTDFGIRLCAAARDVWFLDEFTSAYRVSAEAISKTSVVTPYTYDMLRDLRVIPAAQPALDSARREIAASAISGFTRLGQPKRALQLYLSSDFPLRSRLSPRGIYLVGRIAFGKLTQRARTGS